MKFVFKWGIFLVALITLIQWSGCAGPAHVSVGVGVAVPGPWIGGPYPPGYGGVWVGRPYPGPYYPWRTNSRTFVERFTPVTGWESDSQSGEHLLSLQNGYLRHTGAGKFFRD